MNSVCFRSQFVKVGMFLTVLSVLVGSARAQPKFILRVNDTTAIPGGTGAVELYMENIVDTVPAFQVFLQLDRPDLIKFNIESGDHLAFDTTNTAISGWRLVHVRTMSDGHDASISAIAFVYPDPPVPPILPSPQVLLIRLPFTVSPVPDTLTQRTTHVHIISNLDLTNFSNPAGDLIGVRTQYVADTDCFRCLQWNGSTCLTWQKVAEPPCDSVYAHVDPISSYDTAYVRFYDGSVTIRNCSSGYLVADVDGDGIPRTVQDYLLLLHYIVDGTGSIPDPRAADLNGDCSIDFADVRLLNDYLVHGLQEDFAQCTCAQPVYRCCSKLRGNVDRDIDDLVDLADLTALVEFLFGTGGSLGCPKAANVDGDPAETVDVADLSYLVDYLFGNGAPPPPCN